uniref:Uncharacterized protein n=1 Tax=Anguilla anguilla TaxID=7936 RepID=A0A0E9V879_ANGAN
MSGVSFLLMVRRVTLNFKAGVQIQT